MVRYGTMDWFKIGKGVKAVYCHPAYLTYMQREAKVKVAQSCPSLCDPMHYTVHGILQARILEWVAISFSGGPFQPRDQTTSVSCIGRLVLYH